jgi:hypothetical protein
LPNRLIREGINTSEAVNLLSQDAESVYRRLLLRVDDYGRIEADLIVLRASLFPLQLQKWNRNRFKTAFTECCKSHTTADGRELPELISLYEVNGKQYLEVRNFNQRRRFKSKCPAPPLNALGGKTGQSLPILTKPNKISASGVMTKAALSRAHFATTSARGGGEAGADMKLSGRTESSTTTQQLIQKISRAGTPAAKLRPVAPPGAKPPVPKPGSRKKPAGKAHAAAASQSQEGSPNGRHEQLAGIRQAIRDELGPKATEAEVSRRFAEFISGPNSVEKFGAPRKQA